MLNSIFFCRLQLLLLQPGVSYLPLGAPCRSPPQSVAVSAGLSITSGTGVITITTSPGVILDFVLSTIDTFPRALHHLTLFRQQSYGHTISKCCRATISSRIHISSYVYRTCPTSILDMPYSYATHATFVFYTCPTPILHMSHSYHTQCTDSIFFNSSIFNNSIQAHLFQHDVFQYGRYPLHEEECVMKLSMSYTNCIMDTR